MASSMIHIVVANELNKKMDKDKTQLLIGTIAPDISKLVGDVKKHSHFIDDDGDIPNLDRFLNKYKKNLDDDFVLGYYIHLYTDYLWFKYFIPEIIDKDLITKLDGTVVKCTPGMLKMYIYSDYTNLNTRLLEEYDLDLKIFYNELPEFNNIIEEIPMDRMDIIVNKAGEIIENSKIFKDLVFDIDNVKQFVDLAVQLIESNLRDLNII